mmetsp:Transcript_74202/g.117448  ORF Transcript_74202/g.117448 Transcript_74202/m.117448 type:complete len:347 (-) Transcript_74202:32-1072(-)
MARCYAIACIYLFSRLGTGFAHAHNLRAVEFTPALRGDAHFDSHASNAAFIDHSHMDESLTDLKTFSLAESKTACVSILCLLCFFACCGPCLRSCLGPINATLISWVCTLGILVYLIWNGYYSAMLSNTAPSRGFVCTLLCLWAPLQVCGLSCVVGCLCCFITAAIAIKNEMVKQMRDDYEEKVQKLSGPRQAYYESALFKSKCDTLFEKADLDKNGTLSMSELQSVIGETTGDAEFAQYAPLLQEAFEQHGDSVVEKDEFAEMMKYISVLRWQEGRITEEQAFEILQLPDTATHADVSKAYRDMSRKWHPDKRFGVSADVCKRDQAEVNDAKQKLDEKFKNAGNQ